jgi:hypothetical protein
MPTDKDGAKLYIFKYTLRLQCLLTKTEPSFTSLNTPLGYNAYVKLGSVLVSRHCSLRVYSKM